MLIFDDKDPIFLNNYGFNKHKMGFSDEGIRFIQASLQIKPDNSYAYRNLAMINIDNGELETACDNLKKAKELNFYTKYGNEVNELSVKYCQ